MAKNKSRARATTGEADSEVMEGSFLSLGRPKLSDAEREARKAALKAEPKTERFRRLARKRVTKAVRAIKQLVPLGRGAQYESTPEQADKLLQHLTDAVAEVKIAFAPKSRAARAGQELIDL